MSAFLADFGLAKSVATGSRLTKTGEALGTPAYMSPEQARGEVSALTPATDVWSLGCVLYEMLAGRVAFGGGTPAAVIAAVLTREPPRLQGIRGDVPESVERVVRACLTKRGRHRYPDAAALGEDLDRVLRGERLAARAPHRHRAAAAGIVAAAAVTGLVVGSYPNRAGDRPPKPDARAGSPGIEALEARAAALAAAEPRRAAECLREALERAPDRHDLGLQRGRLLWASGQDDLARAEWSRIPSGTTESPLSRLLLGLEASFRLKAGGLATDEAIPHFQAVLDAPGRVGSIARGALLCFARDWAKAREVLSEAGGWEARVLLAQLETEDPGGDPRSAVRHYDAALEAGIPFAWLFNWRGIARSRSGDPAGAIRDFDRAIEMNPRYAVALSNRGSMKRNLGDRQQALADLDRAIESDPRLAPAWVNRANTKLDLGDHAEAVRDFDRALALDPRLATALSHRGHAKLALGLTADGLRDVQAAVEMAPEDSRIVYNRGVVRLQTGDASGALQDFDRAIAREPSYGSAWNNRGTAKQFLGDLSGAVRDFDRAIELEPGYASHYFNRGNAKLHLGELAEAIRDYTRAIELEPDAPQVWSNRGVAKQRLGDPGGAAADFERTLQLAPPDWPDRRAIEEELVLLRAGSARRGD
ncbi:MAG: tetratricopeptide repeat protein [Planctomycetales bacterium]|nr:tetratricopeptide repeat protein [Planctomycetales bacterium]